MSLLDTASLVITPNGTKASKLYSVVPSDGAGDMTVTRATTATRVNSAGLIESVASNVPRLDYSNGTCPSILVEPQRTNIITRSDNFNSGAWSITGSVSSDVAISLDGTTNADKLVDGVGNGSIVRLLSTNAGKYTYSIFAKKSDRSGIRINSSFGGAIFDLNNGTVVSADSGMSASTVYYGNGWYRCLVTYTSISATYNFAYSTQGSEPIVNGVSGIFIWGAQLEEGAYATSYIPTTSASVTRNADLISKTGISSLIGQTEGTLFIDFDYNQTPNDSNGRFVTIYNTSIPTNSILPLINGVGANANRFQLNIFSNSVVNFAIPASSSTVIPFGRQKLAITYNSGTYVVYRNGSLFANATSLVPLSFSNLELGCDASASRSLANPINSAAIWKTALTNTQLAQLTTI